MIGLKPARLLSALMALSLASHVNAVNLREIVPDDQWYAEDARSVFYSPADIATVMSSEADSLAGGGCVIVMFFQRWSYRQRRLGLYELKDGKATSDIPLYGYNGMAPWCLDSQPAANSQYPVESPSVYDSVDSDLSDSAYLIFKKLDKAGAGDAETIKAGEIKVLYDSAHGFQQELPGLLDHWVDAHLPDPYTVGKADKLFSLTPVEAAYGKDTLPDQ